MIHHELPGFLAGPMPVPGEFKNTTLQQRKRAWDLALQSRLFSAPRSKDLRQREARVRLNVAPHAMTIGTTMARLEYLHWMSQLNTIAKLKRFKKLTVRRKSRLVKLSGRPHC